MREELDKKLVETYPELYANRFGDMKETLMCWGFECGDGWYWLIDNLCYTIQNYIDLNKHLNISQVVATQVKEKFGSLRFYYTGGDSKIGGMVWLAEHLSYKICEDCGSNNNTKQTKGWIKTLCEDCFNEKNK